MTDRGKDRRVGRANGSRECAPDDELNVPTIQDSAWRDGGHGAKSAFAHHIHTLTIRLPRFSPANSPISAFGVFSRPLMTSSWTFNLPEATQDCRSVNASSRWSMKSITIKPCMIRD